MGYTINTAIKDLDSGATTAVIAASKIDHAAILAFCPAGAEVGAYCDLRDVVWAAQAEAEKEEKEEVVVAVEEKTVVCSCGHSVPAPLVMSTTTGTSCPDCYDRMSE